jgi:hypothetical protein
MRIKVRDLADVGLVEEVHYCTSQVDKDKVFGKLAYPDGRKE